MAIDIPKVRQIAARIQAQIDASLNQQTPGLARSFVRVISAAIAGTQSILYRYVGWTLLQQFVASADFEPVTIFGRQFRPLVELGIQFGEGEPNPATNAVLTIDITVETQIGTLNSGAQLVNAATGVTYVTLAPVLLDAPTVSVDVQAVSDQQGTGGAGSIGNMDNGLIMSFANPLANVARDAVVVDTVTTGADAETEEAYRKRVSERLARRPQGGAGVDYRVWGRDVAGIVNIYPYTGDPGEVDVFAEATPESSGNPDGIPTQAQLDAVAASIELDSGGLASRRPVGAFVNVSAIARTGFDVIVKDMDVPDPATAQTDITTALTEFFLDREPFIQGLTIPPRTDKITSTAIVGIVEDVVTAQNGSFRDATFELTLDPGIPLPLYQLGQGEKAKLSSVSFV